MTPRERACGSSPDSEGPSPCYSCAPSIGHVQEIPKSTSAKAIVGVIYSFTASGDIAGGAPRFSIPIDIDGNGTAEDEAVPEGKQAAAVDRAVVGQRPDRVTGYANAVTNQIAAAA